MQQKVHISWHIAAACSGFILGVAVTPFLPFSLPALPVIIVALVLFTIAILRKTTALLGAILFAGLLCGFVRGSFAQSKSHEIQPYIGSVATIQGVVADDASTTANGSQRITLRNIRLNGTTTAGSVWVDTPAHVELKRTDTVRVEGLLHEGFGSAAATMFRARLISVERTTHADVGLEVRDWFASAVRKHIPPLEAALGLGYLLGQRSALPESMSEKLQLLGLTHVVVASGFNLTILVRFTRKLLVKRSKYLATASAVGMLIGFVLITGFSPSMTRAALVTILGLLAWYFGRRVHPLVLLPFAAAITLCINPAYIWGDIGWYLSFVSFAGVLVLAPLIRVFFFGSAEPPAALAIFIETMSAQIATFPITALIFSQYSLVSLPANMLILPFVPLAMLATFIAGIGNVLLPFAADIIALPARAILQYMIGMIDWLGAIPGAGGSVAFGVPLLVVCYIVMILAVMGLIRKTGYRFKDDDPLL